MIEKWKDYDEEGTGWISTNDLAFLLYELPLPIGLGRDLSNINKIGKEMLENDTSIIDEGYNSDEEALWKFDRKRTH